MYLYIKLKKKNNNSIILNENKITNNEINKDKIHIHDTLS